jgi:hypothetical protein
MQFSVKRFTAVNFLVIKTLDSELDPDPNPQLGKMPDPH